MRNNDNVMVRIPFDIKTLRELKGLASRLNLSVAEVLSQAITIFKLAQGRRLILKENDNDDEQWEIKNYRDKEPVLPLKGS